LISFLSKLFILKETKEDAKRKQYCDRKEREREEEEKKVRLANMLRTRIEKMKRTLGSTERANFALLAEYS
jgi:hypothetical protein